MKSLTSEQYQQLRAGAEVLSADGYGDKVLALSSGKIMKLFRRKRLISSALYLPYSRRFARNAMTLAKCGIPTITEIEELKIPSIQRTAVCYRPLEGPSLREIQEAQGGFSEEVVHLFGAFIGRLHELGVFFRSIHFGNIILTQQNEFGLIDIADLRCYRKPLSLLLRCRNFKHTCRYPADRDAMYSKVNLPLYWQSYCNVAQSLSASQQQRLIRTAHDQLHSY
ncbi:MAG: toluene tolerance protein [Pseudomonadales bacterium]|nr:toluene tolerance protein [Pseudomonadales bacterium]MCP5213478.1 toluene tolerance protein [Pseudomonadales bacterium]